jgi:hypothetical protein
MGIGQAFEGVFETAIANTMCIYESCISKVFAHAKS